MEKLVFGDKGETTDLLEAPSQVLIQRHAKSISNLAYEKIADHSDFDQVAKWIWDPDLRDARLWKEGVDQWVKARKLVNKMKIHSVIVSPLRRTLETAYQVYWTHPDFDRIKFVVWPLIRESLNTSSDVPSDIDEILSEFKDLLPNLDCSMFDHYGDKSLYFIEDMQSDVRDKIKSQLVKREDDSLGWNVFNLFVKESKNVFPARLESKWNVYDRSVKAKKFIKNYITDHQVPTDKKVVVLAHFIYFYMHTGEWGWKWDRDQELSYPTTFIRMQNCEIIPDPTSYKDLTTNH